MTSICSVILAFMLSIGGGANLGVHLSEKPHPGLKIETRELRPIQTELNQEQQPVLRFFIQNSRLGVRFLQTDPMGYEDSLNLYQAFNQNPVNFVDPFGDSFRQFIEEKIADMRSRGYPESFITKIRQKFKGAYLRQIHRQNAWAHEMQSAKEYFKSECKKQSSKTKKAIIQYLKNLTDPDNMADTLENLPEIVEDKFVNITNKVKKYLDEGGIKSAFALQRALAEEIYEMSPIPEFSVAMNPNKTLDERTDALAYFTIKTGFTIFAAKTDALLNPKSIFNKEYQFFMRGGIRWHFGLETAQKMNIFHFGNEPTWGGFHFAVGALRPKVADFHIYFRLSLYREFKKFGPLYFKVYWPSKGIL